MTTAISAANAQNLAALSPQGLPHRGFRYVHDKWSTTRSLTVREMADRWQGCPNLVLVLEDRRFKEDPVVMLRKSSIDKMVKLLESLCSGEVAIRHELKSVLDAIALVTDLAEKERSVRDTTLGKAISILGNFKMHLHTTIVTSNPPKELTALPEDDELVKQLPAEDDE